MLNKECSSILQGSTCTGREIGGSCGSASEDSGFLRHDRRYGGS